jgi:protein-tyrosine kinase
MSTIEKAAARLVAKSNAKAKTIVPDSPVVAEAEDVKSPTPVSAEVTSDIAGNNIDNTPDQMGVDAKFDANKDPVADTHHTCELDFEWLAENGFLVPGHKNPQQSQEFRRIKRPLLLNQQPKLAAQLPLPPNVIFVTSALPGEGKTFVSLNLALSLAAELDKRVLLVDGDAAKGDLSRWMGIYEERGLVDLLTSGQPYGESAIIDTNVDRLSVMPCGKAVDNLDELYASDLMGTLLDGIASFDEDRVIVVDGPPLIATTEASVLATRMGQVVMVVEANKTPQSAVEQAAGQLEGCQLVSMLLNKASAPSASGYGYGYGYGYGTSTDTAAG